MAETVELPDERFLKRRIGFQIPTVGRDELQQSCLKIIPKYLALRLVNCVPRRALCPDFPAILSAGFMQEAAPDVCIEVFCQCFIEIMRKRIAFGEKAHEQLAAVRILVRVQHFAAAARRLKTA